jgi:hypothetical protein
MLEFSESPLLLEQGEIIVARVRAGNDIGWGEFSDVNTVGQATQLKPSTPSEVPILISQSESELII